MGDYCKLENNMIIMVMGVIIFRFGGHLHFLSNEINVKI